MEYLLILFDCQLKVVRTEECRATKLRDKVADNRIEPDWELFDNKAAGIQ